MAALRPSFQLHLRAENKSPKTIETYSGALDLLIAFLERTGMPSTRQPRSSLMDWMSVELLKSPPLELRAVARTDEGRLEVSVSRINGRWWVAARCRAWRGFGMSRNLAAAVDAALGPYAGGIDVTRRPR